MWNAWKNTLLCVALLAAPVLAQRGSDSTGSDAAKAEEKKLPADKDGAVLTDPAAQIDHLRKRLDDLQRKFAGRSGPYGGGGTVRDPVELYKSQFGRQIGEQEKNLQRMIEKHGEKSEQVEQARKRLDRLKRQLKFFDSEGAFSADPKDFRDGPGSGFSARGLTPTPGAGGGERGFIDPEALRGGIGRTGAPFDFGGGVSPEEMTRQFEKIMEQMMRFRGPRGERTEDGRREHGGGAPARRDSGRVRSVVTGLESEITALAADIRATKDPAEREQMVQELRDLIETSNRVRRRHRIREIAKLEKELAALREAERKEETVDGALRRLLGTVSDEP
ncbi:MAG: hypothetical protein VX346_16500 [Planctomycetota bacterium]|nr:hypothetical protein [Planctomycetota bacterium]